MPKRKVNKFEIQQNFCKILSNMQNNEKIVFKKNADSFSLLYKKQDKKLKNEQNNKHKTQNRKIKKKSKRATKKQNINKAQILKIKQDHQMCSICLEQKHKNEFIQFKFCKHQFCIDCLVRYVQQKLKNQIFALKCPSCENFVTEQLAFLIPYNEKFLKFLQKRIQTDQNEIGIENYKEVQCPIDECQQVCQQLKSADYFYCLNCLNYICALCNTYDHQGQECLKVSEKFLDRKFDDLQKEQKFQRCPQCFYYIEKNGGCSQVACRCGYSMCYICGNKTCICK